MWSGERIRHLRRRLGWSTAELSRRLGCSIETLESYESGHVKLDDDVIQQLEVLSFHLDSYNEMLARSPEADQVLDSTGKDQIHKKDLKKS